MVSASTTNPKSRRQGFTLIELLIVIAIIAVLASLIIPAVGGAGNKARIAGVKSEINQLETAISKFKADHNMEPPSSIRLYEHAAEWDQTDTTTINSRAAIRTMWPQFNFSIERDLNNDGDTDSTDSYDLTPGECLVLFLGGMFTTTTTAGVTRFSMIGFSKDPTDPFAAPAAGVAREAPLFEFRSDRLTDVNNNGIPEYRDNLPGQTRPYLYYSSYDGAGYITAEFVGGANSLSTFYRQGTATTDPAWKPTSHQIISPGSDTQYGYGGPYVTTSAARLPPATAGSPTPAERAPEADNITNFSDTVLQP